MLATTLKNTLPTKKPIDIKHINLQTTQNPYYTPTGGTSRLGACLPAGGKILLSGDVLRGLGPPGKAMAEKSWLRTLGPGVRGVCPRGRNKRGGENTYHES
jgi:hypothetical protein